MLYYISLY